MASLNLSHDAQVLLVRTAKAPLHCADANHESVRRLSRDGLVAQYKSLVLITAKGLLELDRRPLLFLYANLCIIVAWLYKFLFRLTTGRICIQTFERNINIYSKKLKRFLVKSETVMINAVTLNSTLKGEGHSTVIGEDLIVKADIDTGGDVYVNGKVEGDICCRSLVVDKYAHVSGAVVANTVVVRGRVGGPISSKHLTVHATGSVESRIRSEHQQIALGAHVMGETCRKFHDNSEKEFQSLLKMIEKSPVPLDKIHPGYVRQLCISRLAFKYYGYLFITTFGVQQRNLWAFRWFRRTWYAMSNWNRELLIPGRGLRPANPHLKQSDELVRMAASSADSSSPDQSGVKPVTIIAKDLKLACALTSEGDVQVYGEIGGNVECASLAIAEEAQILGGVVACSVEILGNVSGLVRVRQANLRLTSDVDKHVYHELLQKKRGTHFKGAVERSENLSFLSA